MLNSIESVSPVSIDPRQLLDGVHDPVLIFDPDGEIVLEVNDRACDAYGLTREEFVGMSLKTISCSESEGTKHIAATLQSSGYHSFWTVQCRGDGTELVMEVHALPVRWEGRLAILSINRDITLRVDMLRRLRNAAAEWQLTVDALHASLVLVDADGQITRANANAAHSAGEAGVADIIGRPLAELSHHPPWDRAAQLARTALDRRLPAAAQVTDNLLHKAWDIAVTLTARADGDTQAVVIIRDITHSVELEAALRRNENMAAVGRLVAGVAHEVRNPLFIISASLDALFARCPELDETAQQLRANLDHEVKRLTALMHDLLDYAKPTALNAVVDTIDVVLAESVSSVCMHAAEKNVRIVNAFPPGIPALLMDPLRLAQAFHNILHNAIHYSPAGGVITVDGHETGRDGRSWIVCTIDDSGPGFCADTLGSLFEPFFSKRPGGTGLGLSIVQRTVEMHGGRITAANRDGGGARMTVELPRFR